MCSSHKVTCTQMRLYTGQQQQVKSRDLQESQTSGTSLPNSGTLSLKQRNLLGTDWHELAP